MRVAVWVFAAIAICAIASADSPTGTVIVSCNESDAELFVDNVLIPDRTPAVLTMPAGTHVIEVRKQPFTPQKKTVEVLGSQQVKVRFDLVPPPPPPPLPPLNDVAVGSGSAGSGSALPPQAGSGSAVTPPTGSATPHVVATPPPPPPPPPPEHHCRQGGHEVPCPPEGPHCTMGGKLVSCATGRPLPPPAPTPPPGPVVAVATGSGSGSAAPVDPHVPTGPSNLVIHTTVPRAIAFVDGVPVRDAPCELDLEPGEHIIAVYAAGMLPAETVVRIDPSRHQRVDLNPTRPRQRIDVPEH